MAAWRLFGKDVTAEQLPAELRSILAQMQRERVAFEALTNAAREAAQNVTQLTQPIADAQKTVSELQGRVKALERLVPVLATLDEQTEAVSKVQRRTETQLTHTSEDAKRLRGEIEELRGALEGALALKNDLAGFLELGGGFKALRMDADKLTAEVRDITQGFDRVRERQEELRRAGEGVATRLNAFEERQQQVHGGFATTESRVAALGQTLQELTQAAADAAQTKRQLGVLKSLADAVTQKVSALEQQREVVERATGQVTHLHDLMREVDAKIRKHEESAKGLGELEAKVLALRALHGDVLERTEEISARHDAAKRTDEELRGRLAALRDEVQRTVKRFELENQGLDAVTKRILDLRGGLTDMEARFKALDESSRTIADVRSRADGLASQLNGIAEHVADLETQAERVNTLEASAGRLGETVEDMTQRVARLEKARPAVEAALQDVASLKGTHETVKDAVEQVQMAESEIARAREGQASTKAWLTSATESVTALRGELASIEEMKPTVELVRADADRLSQSMAQIEARRQLVQDLNTRLSELATLGGQLEERTRGLLARMEGADERFIALAAHADEAARIEQGVPKAVATVERAERRVADVDAAVAGLEARAQNLEGLAERTRALGQELELRQGALDKATDQLGRVSQLREEAAAIAQALEERTGQLTGALATAGGRATEVTATLDDLESRAASLRFVQKRMAQFEERLAKWEAVDAHLTRALDQVTQRQATLDAMQADMHRLFEVAERTTDDVRSIAAAKEEVTQTRATLENVLSLVSHAHDAANGLEHRKREVEQAEERLGRAEALLDDIHSHLETLHGQKAFMDQVIEQAGSLAFHAKQAEALIATLREEREITDSVRAAVAQLRGEGVAKSA
jgi:DNA repair exonuclease SbcCD ATPase subunit